MGELNEMRHKICSSVVVIPSQVEIKSWILKVYLLVHLHSDCTSLIDSEHGRDQKILFSHLREKISKKKLINTFLRFQIVFKVYFIEYF